MTPPSKRVVGAMTTEQPGQPGATEYSYKDHRIAYRDDEEHFELWIDGRSWGHMVGRLGPNTYYSHIFPFREYESAEEIAQAIVDREGEAWVAEEGDEHPPHDSSHHAP